MGKKMKVTISFTTTTEESSETGEFADKGWIDKEGAEFDTIEEVIEYLEDGNVIEPSTPCPTTRTWYDTAWDKDMYSGEQELRSYHVKNITKQDATKIFKELFPIEYEECNVE